MPKVSVILPVVATPQNLNRAIASVLKQNMAELELIVVDGLGGDSDLQAIVAGFSAEDARVQYVCCESREAAEVAAVGLRTARASWIAFQRDGDEWLLDRLGQQLNCAAQQGDDCQLIAGRLLQYMPVAKTRLRYWGGLADRGRLLLNAGIVDFAEFLQTALIHRSALENGGAFNPQSPLAQDFEWCRVLLDQGAAAVPTCVTVTYISSGIVLPNAVVRWVRQALKR